MARRYALRLLRSCVPAVKSLTEVELKFLVSSAARAKVAVEMARGSSTLKRTSLAAMYLDTDDRRLARAGMAWRLRREGRRWVQSLKAGGSNSLLRFEHEVVRPNASHDASEHSGTPVGDELMALLSRARKDGVEPGVRFRTEVRRSTRKVRTRGAVVEVAFDEGRLLAPRSSQRILEIEFELVSGSTVAMLALAERWRRRFGLIYDPRSKAERGDRLAQGSSFPPLRKACGPTYSSDATAAEAFGVVLDECLAQVTHNAVGLSEGDPALRVEHVHQLRVGIRRLRSALRSFQGWAPSPPAELVERLGSLFATLGLSRESDVLDTGVVAELARLGAPPLKLQGAIAGVNPVEAVRATDTQRTFLAWIAWRASFVESSRDDATNFPNHAERRLRRWHRGIAADSGRFDELDEASLHALRKRIKRQRYAVEFFAPVLRCRQVEHYLSALIIIQDRMGELNDLFVARARYAALVVTDPAAWFALGWLAARVASVRALAKPELEQLLKADSPGIRGIRHASGRASSKP